jgi:uncharacterized protein (TIGR03086 family)
MEMKSDVGVMYSRAIEQANRVVAGIRPEQLDLPTPCREWNARQVLNHFIGSNLMMASAGAGKTMSGTSGTEAISALGDLVGDDPASAYASSSSSAEDAFNAPGALERLWTLPFAELPGAMARNIHFVETLAHTWDLAKSTGQLDKLDPELAAAGDATAHGFVQPEFRNEKGDPFAAEVATAPDAGAYDRFACFLGRTP